jgi:hypothetical protein
MVFFPMTSLGWSHPLKKGRAVKNKKAKRTIDNELTKEKLRLKAKREKEFRQEAIRARKFSAAQTLGMGIELIECALELRKAGKDVQN